jgi:hypothetical protein
MACRRIDEYITLSQILKKHLTEHLRARSGPSSFSLEDTMLMVRGARALMFALHVPLHSKILLSSQVQNLPTSLRAVSICSDLAVIVGGMKNDGN